MRVLVAGCVAATLIWQGAFANPRLEDLSEVLRVKEVVAIMRDEGLRYGDSLNIDMLGGNGGQYFTDNVRRIYDADKMAGFLQAALDEGLNDHHIEAVLTFFDTDLGQQLLDLENAARVAISDPAVEEIARATYTDLSASGDQRLDRVAGFVAANDLIEQNVASALNSNYFFFRGFVDAGGDEMTESAILEEVWSQETELREDTKSWMYGFLLMAYRPVSDADLKKYVAFSRSAAGQALNTALFAGFDDMYQSISYALGQATAQGLDASDI